MAVDGGVAVVTLRLPIKLAQELKTLAARERTSQNHEATVAIRAHVDADKQRRGK